MCVAHTCTTHTYQFTLLLACIGSVSAGKTAEWKTCSVVISWMPGEQGLFLICVIFYLFNLSKIRTKLLLKTKALNFFLIIHGARTIATSHIS